MKDLKGKIFYGLHFVPGVAEYREKDPIERIYINEQTAKNMDSSFQGRPVFVQHEDKVDEKKFEDADGYVIESFYNKSDGSHWAKFFIRKEEAYNKIVNEGWRLSNAYRPSSTMAGGECHGVQYDKQIVEGVYEHLAIVPVPRYDESVVYSPQEFKDYNERREAELNKVANSKPKNKGINIMFDFFKKEKVNNEKDIEDLVVTLPNSKKEMCILDLIKNADSKIVNDEKKDESKEAQRNMDMDEKKENMDMDEKKENMDEHMVKVNGEEMKLSDLKSKYEQMMKKKNMDEDEDMDNMKKNAKAFRDFQNAQSFKSIQNAENDALKNEKVENTVILKSGIKMGMERYGS